jgi:hypothetical protein
MSDQAEKPKKAIRKSKTMWLAAATAVAGAVLTAAPQAMPELSVGPGLVLIGALQAILRVYTSQPVR